jgi:uncharacterized membrane protein YeaQ/YmgE (transglycosylase-associated protein family)
MELAIVFYGLLLSIVAGVIAHYKGRSFRVYFTFSIVFCMLGFIGAFISPDFLIVFIVFIPLLGIIGALVAKAKPTEGRMKTNRATVFTIALIVGVITVWLLIFFFELLTEG